MRRLHAVAVRQSQRAVAVCPRVLHTWGNFGSVSAYPFLRMPLSLVELVFCSTPLRFVHAAARLSVSATIIHAAVKFCRDAFSICRLTRKL